MLSRRRGSKNSGGGIAPAAIAGLIEGAPCSVNAFGAPGTGGVRSGGPDKVLNWLNFSGTPGNA